MDPSTLPTPFTPQLCRELGISRRQLDEWVHLGEVVRLSRGQYAPLTPVRPDQEEWERTQADHLLRLRHQLSRFPGHVASHSSAALLHGLAISISPMAPVEITAVESVQRSRREPGVTLHHSDSVRIPVTEVEGLRTTTPLRTTADTARTRRLAHGTALIDDALRRELVTRPSLLRELHLHKRWLGRPKALAAVALSDPRRETWLESFSFISLHEQGVSLPLAQVDIFDDHDRFLARVDGLLSQSGTFLEADGLGKYFLDMSPTVPAEESVRHRLASEETRHTALTNIGLRGVRWTTDEIMHDAEGIAGRVKRQGGPPPTPIRGYAVWQGERRRIPFEAETPSVDLEQIFVTRQMRRAARHRD